MKIHEKGSNYTVILFERPDDVYVLFSYKTPVAYNDSKGFKVSAKHWSATTTRHIRKFLNGASCDIVEQEEIDNLLNKTVAI